MRKSITGVVALLAGALVVYSQGTVSFANYLVLPSYIYVSLMPGNIRLGGGGNILPVDASGPGYGDLWTVALYGAAGWGDPPNSLVQLETASGQPVTATFANGINDSVNGTWFSTAVAVVPGTSLASAEATVQLRAWYNDWGTITTYSAALATGVPSGFSPPVNLTVGSMRSGGTLLPSGMSFSLTTSAIPEPSTIALAVMGASAFLLGLRKKL